MPTAPKPKSDSLKKPSDTANKAEAAPAKKAAPLVSLVRGMRDLLPADQPYWKKIYEALDRVSAAYGFDRIDTPLIEEQSLFVRGVGKVTDIVEKEMFSWETQGGEHIALRPEGGSG